MKEYETRNRDNTKEIYDIKQVVISTKHKTQRKKSKKQKEFKIL